MFGTLRYLLAVVVLIAHFTTVPLVGKPAVYSFFMLSGYLMTHILNKVYRENVKGYLVNRVLRIYPTYLTVLLLVFAAAFIPGFFIFNNPGRVVLPETLSELVLSFIWPNTDAIRPAWTLKVELFYYVVMIWIVTSYTRVRTWFYISLGIAGLMLIAAMKGSPDAVGKFISASVPFSFGAWLWHQRKEREAKMERVVVLGSLMALLLFVPVFYISGNDTYEFLHLILVTGLSGLFVIELSYINGKFKKVDEFLGDLSYPIYLCHILVGSVVVAVFGLTPRSISMVIVSAVFIHVLSIGIKYLVDRPIERLRRRIRSTSSSPGVVYNPLGSFPQS